MAPTRREFLQGVGIALASLALTRCIVRPIRSGGTARERLRDAWFRLDDLARETRDAQDTEGKGRDALCADHRAALDELVAAGALTPAVADDMQEAFVAAAHHVWRSNAPITCYIAMPMPNYGPTSAAQLAQQAAALEELAAGGQIDPATAAKARTAIERDVAFLALSDADTEALYERLRQAAEAGQPYPSFDEVDLAITPEARQAAEFLVAVLTGA